MLRTTKYTFLLIFVLLSLSPGSVAAQEATPVVPDDAVNEIAKEMYCPVCENVPLDVCGTTACQQWRELIREKLAAGETEAEIKAYFVQQYGDRVLAEPPREGLNWLVYVVPPVAILAGAIIVFSALRAWNTEKHTLPPAESSHAQTPSSPEDEYVKRLENELEQRQSQRR